MPGNLDPRNQLTPGADLRRQRWHERPVGETTCLDIPLPAAGSGVRRHRSSIRQPERPNYWKATHFRRVDIDKVDRGSGNRQPAARRGRRWPPRQFSLAPVHRQRGERCWRGGLPGIVLGDPQPTDANRRRRVFDHCVMRRMTFESDLTAYSHRHGGGVSRPATAQLGDSATAP